LSDNPIAEIPEFIGGFKDLEFLDLFRCEISHVPNFIDELPDLVQFGIGENPIADLENVKKRFPRSI
jgi:Leucine-rich repeat (LRR) protein